MALTSFFPIGNRYLLGKGVAFRKVGAGPNIKYTILTGQISAANMISTAAGALSHANGVIMAPAAPTGYINRLDFCVVTLKFGTAAYTLGGDTTVNIGGGGAALTGLVANTVLIQAAATVTIEFVPLAATKNTYTTANPLNLVTTAAVTNPGTAAGTINWVVGFYTIGPVSY